MAPLRDSIMIPDLLALSPRKEHNYYDPAKELYAGLWCLFTAATAFLALRVWVKISRRHGLWYDDYLLVLCWIILLGTDILITTEYAIGYANGNWDDRMHILINISSDGTVIGQALTKTAFAITLLRMCRASTRSRWPWQQALLWFCIITMDGIALTKCVFQWAKMCTRDDYQQWYRIQGWCLDWTFSQDFKEVGNNIWRDAVSQIWYSAEVAGTIIVQCVPVLRPFLKDLHTSLTSRRLDATEPSQAKSTWRGSTLVDHKSKSIPSRTASLLSKNEEKKSPGLFELTEIPEEPGALHQGPKGFGYHADAYYEPSSGSTESAQMSSTTTSGQCLCGKVQVTVTGKHLASLPTLTCHCVSCKRRSGGVASYAFVVPKQNVRFQPEPNPPGPIGPAGGPHKIFVDNDTGSGHPMQRTMCAECGSPVCIIESADPDARCLQFGLFADSQGVDLSESVRGGGNHASGASSAEDGLVIDLSNLNSISVDANKGQVTVGGGCRWGDVYSALQKEGLICVGGGVHIVGVGGHLTGGNGGWGPLTGKYGMGCDNVLSSRVVLADGRIVTASETDNPDLSWAIKDPDRYNDVWTSFREAAEPSMEQTVGSLSIADLSHSFDDALLKGPPRVMNAGCVVTDLWPGMAEELWESFITYTASSPDVIDSMVALEFHATRRKHPVRVDGRPPPIPSGPLTGLVQLSNG
ncbi:hypothetical protein SLS63_008144 [Diaporthe eres]|uniref:FAD-binding PCMH-type domain-containing protein n=1 Tax=Diaporthe eres TaxID=83184 RepID=A0ABR1P3I7_DIAER